MTNLDLFADDTAGTPSTPAPAHAKSIGPAAREWGLSGLEVAAASTNRKTVLKSLKDAPADLEELLQAWLLVAKHKAQAYARTLCAGQATQALDGWIYREPELAHATGLVSRAFFDVSEVPMMPQSLMIA